MHPVSVRVRVRVRVRVHAAASLHRRGGLYRIGRRAVRSRSSSWDSTVCTYIGV